MSFFNAPLSSVPAASVGETKDHASAGRGTDLENWIVGVDSAAEHSFVISDANLDEKEPDLEVNIKTETTSRDGHFFQIVEALSKDEAFMEREAVVSLEEEGERRLTYKELNEQANRLAHYLLAQSLLSKPIIGLFLHQSPEFIISMLAVWKAGLAFMPLSTDPATSLERLLNYMEGSDISFILSHSRFKPRSFLASPAIEKVTKLFLDEAGAEFANCPSTNPGVVVKPDQLAYVLNSSGTTGKPKKILTEFKGLTNCMLSHHETLQINEKDKIAMFADIGFDASIIEIMMPLGKGACLCIVPYNLRNDLVKLPHFYTSNAITVGVFSPSMLQRLRPEKFPTLRAVIITGEKIESRIIEDWYSKGRPTEFPRLLINGYGPSEVTIATSIGVLKPDDDIHIGQPIKGLEMFALETDVALGVVPKPVKAGEAGELYIAGTGLARGYLDEKQTLDAFRFIPHPNRPEETIRVFKTRDVVKRLDGNRIQMMGRLDRQVKIYGRLVCPEEIEAVLETKTDTIQRAYVDIRTAASSHPIISAYVQPKEGACVDLRLWYKCVSTHLLTAMVPTHWYVIEEMPLQLSSKKIDGKALVNLVAEGKFKAARLQGPSEQQPRKPLEIELAELWREILMIEDKEFQFHIDDDFRELGGTSLQGAVLLQQLRQRYRLKLTVTEFLQAPTLGALARRIQRENATFPALPQIITLCAEPASASRPPLVLIHSLMCDAERDYDRLKESWPVVADCGLYTISARGLDDPEDMDENLLAIAADYIKAIEVRWPRGPYLLGGWSAGGIIAFVMATMLRARGKEVALAMIDSESPTIYQEKSKEEYATYLLDLFNNKLASFVGIEKLSLTQQALAKLPKENQVHTWSRAINDCLQKSADGKTETKLTASVASQNLVTSIRNLLLAILRHSYDMSLSNVTLFAAEQTQKTSQSNERLRWPVVANFDSIISLPGNHESIVSDLLRAKTLSAQLNQFCTRQLAQFKTTATAQMLCSAKQVDIDEEELHYYIPARGSWHNDYKESFELDKKITELFQAGKKVILLLGGSGAGKTIFCQHMATRLVKPTHRMAPIVLYFNLASFTDPLHELIEQRLKREDLSSEQIEHLRRHQEFIFILNGYDEIPTAMQQNLYVTNRLDRWNAKVIISCRTSFLMNMGDYQSRFMPRQTGKLDSMGLKELHLTPFSDKEIEAYVDKYIYLKGKSEQKAECKKEDYLRHMEEITGLKDLISTPFLLCVYMQIFPIIKREYHNIPEEKRSITRSKLLAYFADNFFNRQRYKLTLNGNMPAYDVTLDYREFLTQLAKKMAQEKVTHISYRPRSGIFQGPETDPWGSFFGNRDEAMRLAREGAIGLLRQLPSRDPGNNSQCWAFLHADLRDYFANTDMFSLAAEGEIGARRGDKVAEQKTSIPEDANSKEQEVARAAIVYRR